MSRSLTTRHPPGRPSGPLLGALALSACAMTGEVTESLAVARDSAGITIVENDLTRLSATCALDSMPTVSIGADTGASEYQLYRVFGARRLSDDRIVLVNQGSEEIRFYDRQGKFLGRAGRAGEGPGEFRNAFHLWALPGDTIWVGDYRPWEFDVFAPDGTWLRAVKPTPQYPNSPSVMVLLDDGRSILADRPLREAAGNFQVNRVAILLHGADGTLLDTIGTYPDGRWGTIGNDRSLWLFPFFEAFTRVAGGGSQVVIGHGSKTELFVYRADDTLRLARVIRWTTDDRAISADDVAAARAKEWEPYKDAEPELQERLGKPLISEERPVADEFPAFSGIIAGRDGRIWIREYPRPRMPDARRMVAFDADGRVLCRATFPASVEPLEIGADYLLALTRDSLRVERVQQYWLRGPAEPR
jgi:hypothetical protein